jgi:hypothetical protein
VPVSLQSWLTQGREFAPSISKGWQISGGPASVATEKRERDKRVVSVAKRNKRGVNFILPPASEFHSGEKTAE